MTEPEQWAVELLHDVNAVWMDYGSHAAAEALQRAFEEQTQELREALRPFANVKILPDGSVVGLERHWFIAAKCALATRQDAPVTENSHDH